MFNWKGTEGHGREEKHFFSAQASHKCSADTCDAPPPHPVTLSHFTLLYSLCSELA